MQETAVAAGEEGDVPDLLPGGWKSDEERHALLAKCANGTPEEERVEALCCIREKALLPAHLTTLWEDEELCLALLACAEPPDPDFGKNPFAEEEPDPPTDLVRTLAVTIFACLATCEENRHPMAKDFDLRHVIASAALDVDRPILLRERAVLLLGSLALAGGCFDPSDDGVPTEPPSPTTCEECGCCPCVCKAGDKVWLNEDIHICHGLAVGLGKEVSSFLRAKTLGILCSMATASTLDASRLWRNRRIRTAVIDTCDVNETEEVRVAALEALWAFSACDLLQEGLWAEAKVRNTLLKAAEGSKEVNGALFQQSVDIRGRALRALANLATSLNNQRTMWCNQHLSLVLLEAVSAGGIVRADAMDVLVELSKNWTNRPGMVAAGLSNLFRAAADDEGLQSDERRNCQFACERLAAAVECS
mmetsp:Transcript_68203/g.142525  ORF Transcript_68203/g.142525 Transcript_68203/m.142525 type:complete len:420 (+) Transcript_68203:102-1361(+)|eukprot:CAMPEP_0206433184 /NCGR_PEP_ID=MMETSP0324_2-20121206/8384_1 /ASSEMBLY_ACC=CAM_ASM_000836 /TAXON_ID=2866 /ORGANISM="Crypthecodinium cohnii, Strain Seligo" /LENGTH=419 /DNA_ID=CAMNT_0053899405 /DNA_START=81 /DNA_END=1340 /DNA_ORIENTATION=-